VRLLPVLAGASLGLGAVLVWERERLEAGPPGWEVDDPELPVYLASLAGAPRLPGEGWPLGSRFSLKGGAPVSRLSVLADIPPGGSLTLALSPPRGDAAILTAPRFGGGGVVLGRQDLRSSNSPTLSALQSCQGELSTLPEGPVWLGLEVDAGGQLRAWVGEQSTRCAWGERAGQPLLIAGLSRVGLHELHADQQGVRAPTAAWPARLLAVAIGGLLALGSTRLRPLQRSASLVWAPFLLCAPLALLDLDAWQQEARLLLDHPLRLALGLPALVSALLLTVLAALALARRPRGSLPATLGLGALVGAGLVALAAPQWPVSIALSAATGASLAALVWVNAHAERLRYFNLLSLALVGLAVVGAENALIWTATGQRLVGVSNRAAAGWTPHMEARDPLDDLREVETVRHHRIYPSEGYPVAPPPRSAPLRIVALGSSSTGGAFQFDDLDLFWPAVLERQLGAGVQVINQAVGGWTSLHMRRYIETRIEDLDPDLFVVYLGNNDFKQRSSRPYRELLAELQGEAGRPRPTALLARVRLFQLLRFSLSPLATQAQDAAVPLSHARDNLEALVELARAREAPVLLVSEAVYPDPAELSSYAAMMASLADGEDVRFIDGAEVLLGPASWQYFLDNVHLSEEGHRRLEAAIRAELLDAGWVGEP